MLVDNLIIPKYIREGIKKNELGYHDKINVLAGDTETNKDGKPYLLILQSKDTPDLIPCNEGTTV